MEKESLYILTLNLNWYNIRSCIMCTYIMCNAHTAEHHAQSLYKGRKNLLSGPRRFLELWPTSIRVCYINSTWTVEWTGRVWMWFSGWEELDAPWPLKHTKSFNAQALWIITVSQNCFSRKHRHSDSGLVLIKLIFHSWNVRMCVCVIYP